MKFFALLAIAICHATAFAATTPASTNTVSWPTTPLSIKDAVEVALRQNSAVLKSQADLEAVYGVVVQTRAIQLPRVAATAAHTLTDQGAIEQAPFAAGIRTPDQAWNVRVQITQSIYEGGKIESALRTAKLTPLRRHE